MTPSGFDYHQFKPGSVDMLKGFILALSIHGVLFFVGGRLFVKPVQYSVQSADGSIDVDLVSALPQPDMDGAKTITSTAEQQQKTVKIVPHKEMLTLPQTDVDSVKSIRPITEQHPETAKIVHQEEQAALPQPDVDAIKPITPIMEQQKEAKKTLLRPSQGTVRMKSKPDYLQNQPPKYPQRAKQLHQEGLVILSVDVDQKGMPVKVEIEQSSGYQLLDQAALKAVKHWTFQPERIGGLPVESRVSIPVRFRLE